MMTSLSEREKKFIRENRLTLTGAEMAAKLHRVRSTVIRFINREGLQLTKEEKALKYQKTSAKLCTALPNEDQFITDHYLALHVKEIAEKLNRSNTFVRGRMKRLKLIVPDHIIAERKKAYLFQKGTVAHNKGMKWDDYMSAEAIELAKASCFKPGNITWHTKEVGEETIRYQHKECGKKIGYRIVKVSANEWKMYHHLVWERVHGSIPEGKFIIFKNKNPEDCSIENLELVSKAELMKKNSILNYPPDIQELLRLHKKLKRTIEKKLTNGKEQNA